MLFLFYNTCVLKIPDPNVAESDNFSIEKIIKIYWISNIFANIKTYSIRLTYKYSSFILIFLSEVRTN